jgi:hypothetical protein
MSPQLKYLRLLPENKRPEVYHGIETIVSRYDNEPATAVMLPPRFGKSDIIRGSILELMARGATTSIVLVPWVQLADQIKDKAKLGEMYPRFGIPVGTPFLCHRCTKMATSHWYKPYDGSYNLVSLTMGLVMANTVQFFDGLEQLCQTLGQPVPLFIDECHLFQKTQAWSAIALKAQEIGCYLIPLTGTAIPGMPGFEETMGDWEDTSFTIFRRKNIGTQINYVKATYEGRRREILEINADVEVSWAEAWRQGALAKVNAIWIDTDVIDSNTNDNLGRLSELDKDEVRPRLKQILTSPDWIQKAADAGIDRFLRRKHRPQMLVVTAFDEANGLPNSHARAFKKALKIALDNAGCSSDDYRIEIATGIDNEGNLNDQARRIISDYVHGKIDILIVKMMGLVGLDVPRAKVEIFASQMSQGPLVAQAFSRPLTIWDLDPSAADLILSDHVLIRETYDKLIKDQGGTAVQTEVQLVEEVPAKPPGGIDDPLCHSQDAVISGYSDQYGKMSVGDMELILRIIKSKYNIGNLTDPEILENEQRGGYPITEEDREQYQAGQRAEAAQGFKDLDEDLADLKGVFGKKAQRITFRYVPKNNMPLWRDKVRELQNKAKELVGVPLSIEVPDIDDAKKLQQLIEALDQAAKIVF